MSTPDGNDLFVRDASRPQPPAFAPASDFEQPPGFAQPPSQVQHTGLAPQVAYPPEPVASTERNWLGIVSLVAPFVGLGIVGIVCGHLGQSAARQGRANNRGVALAGTIVSYASVAFGLLLLVAVGIPLLLNETAQSTDDAAMRDLETVAAVVAEDYRGTSRWPVVELAGGTYMIGETAVASTVNASDVALVTYPDSSQFCVELGYDGGRAISYDSVWGFLGTRTCPAVPATGGSDARGSDTEGPG
jgi:hypothetical protein